MVHYYYEYKNNLGRVRYCLVKEGEKQETKNNNECQRKHQPTHQTFVACLISFSFGVVQAVVEFLLVLCSVLPPLPVPTTQNYYSRFAFTERDD
jgi:hypothetical protein